MIFSPKWKSGPDSQEKFYGQLETNPENLKKLYLETYKHRLRHRPIRSDLVHLKDLKERLFALRLRLVKLEKSKPWTTQAWQKMSIV